MRAKQAISILLCLGFPFSVQAARGKNKGRVRTGQVAASASTQALASSSLRETLSKAENAYLQMQREPDRIKWPEISEGNGFSRLVQESMDQFREDLLMQLHHLQGSTVLITPMQSQFFTSIPVCIKLVQHLSFAAADLELTPRRGLSPEGKRAYIPGQLERAFSFIQKWMAFAADVEVEVTKISPAVLKRAGFSPETAIAPVHLAQIGDVLAHLSLTLQPTGAYQTCQYLTPSATGGRKARREHVSYKNTLVQLLALIKEPALQEAEFDSDPDMYRTRIILLKGYWGILLLDTKDAVPAKIAEIDALLSPYWDRQPVNSNMILQSAWSGVAVGVAAICEVDLRPSSPLQQQPQDLLPAQNSYQYYLEVEKWVYSRLPDVQAKYEAINQDEAKFRALREKKAEVTTPEDRWLEHALVMARMNFPIMIEAREYLFKRQETLREVMALLEDAELEVVQAELLEEEEVAQTEVLKEKETKEQAEQAKKEKMQEKAYAAYCAKKQAQAAAEMQRLQERAQQETVQVQEPAWRKAQRDAILLRYTHGNFSEGYKAFLYAWGLVNQGTPGPDNLEVCIGLAEYLLAWVRHCFYDDALALVAQMEQEVAHYHATKEWVSKSSVLRTVERLETVESVLASQNVAQLLHDSLMYYRQSLAFPDFMWNQQHDLETTKDNLSLLMEIPQILQQWPALLERWKKCRKEYLKTARVSADGVSSSSSSSQPLVFPDFTYLHALAPLGAEIAKLHAEKEILRADSAVSVSTRESSDLPIDSAKIAE